MVKLWAILQNLFYFCKSIFLRIKNGKSTLWQMNDSREEGDRWELKGREIKNTEPKYKTADLGK